eukprot:IDg22275t1
MGSSCGKIRASSAYCVDTLTDRALRIALITSTLESDTTVTAQSGRGQEQFFATRFLKQLSCMMWPHDIKIEDSVDCRVLTLQSAQGPPTEVEHM